ncbi:MAG: FAD-dependent oxidoreductase, partial [Thermoanaerobaculia bacterium]
MQSITIIGAGYAGALAASRIARRGAPVTLIDANAGLVERIRLHQVLAGDDIPAIPYRELFRNLPVDFVQARVTGIDRRAKQVLTTDGPIAYDKLVYALGSVNATPEHTVSVGNPMLARQRLSEAKEVVIVGGGLTGIETAAELAERHPHLAITLMDRGTIGKGLSERARKHLHEWMTAHHVTLREHTE